MEPARPEGDDRIGLILLGASSFPAYPSERNLDHDSFGKSAFAFREAMTAPGRTVLGDVDVLDLFDSDAAPAELVGTIQDFLTARPHLADIVLYYCGHGTFLADGKKTYALLLRATKPKLENFTALPFEQTRHQLEEQLGKRRVVLVLDACFAGHAAMAFQSSVGDVIEQQVLAAFPPSATTLLLASSKDRPGIAPGGVDHTMFTGGLVHVLKNGISGGRETITLDELLSATADQIKHQWGNEGVLPEIQSPKKSHGDLAKRPYFRNAAFVPPAEAGPTQAEELMLKAAMMGLESELKGLRTGALQEIDRLAAKTASRPFRQELVAILRDKAEHDDSKSVRESAAGLLGRYAEAESEAPAVPMRVQVNVPPPPPPTSGQVQKPPSGTSPNSESVPERPEPVATRKWRFWEPLVWGIGFLLVPSLVLFVDQAAPDSTRWLTTHPASDAQGILVPSAFLMFFVATLVAAVWRYGLGWGSAFSIALVAVMTLRIWGMDFSGAGGVVAISALAVVGLGALVSSVRHFGPGWGVALALALVAALAASLVSIASGAAPIGLTVIAVITAAIGAMLVAPVEHFGRVGGLVRGAALVGIPAAILAILVLTRLNTIIAVPLACILVGAAATLGAVWSFGLRRGLILTAVLAAMIATPFVVVGAANYVRPPIVRVN